MWKRRLWDSQVSVTKTGARGAGLMGRERVCGAMVGYSMEGGQQRTALCRLGRLWGVTCWAQVGEVKDPGVR